jgi:hypothetical protein
VFNTIAVGATLYAITLSEGVRRLPAEAIVLRRFGFGPWRFVRRVEIGAGIRLISWCLPASLPLVLQGGTSPVEADDIREQLAMMRHRLAEARLSLGLLRMLGLMTLILLVAGVPIAVERSGLFGLVAAAIVLLELTFVQALWTGWLLRRLGASGRSAAAKALKLLNPFGVQRAAEIVLARIVGEVPVLAVACELLGQEEFVHAFRPMLYDALHGDAPQPGLSNLTPLVADGRLASLLGTAPIGLGTGAFCPRCASQFASGVPFCSDCDGVPLVGGESV